MSFPFYKQHDGMDCGPACLRMVARYYGLSISLQELRERCYIDREGVSLMGIAEAADSIGLRTLAVKIPFEGKYKSSPSLIVAPLPAILHWNQKHFVVVYKINKRWAWIADPASGKVKIPIDGLKRYWLSDEDKGIVMLLEPIADFTLDLTTASRSRRRMADILKTYLRPHNKLIIQVLLGMILASIFQLIFPFLTQAVVDVGIDNADFGFIWLVLIAQLMLFVGQTSVRFIQGWLLLHVSIRINVSLISDFLLKLMKLPLGYFDSKMIGDLLQRVNDHRRVEQFLTQSSLSMMLAIANFIVFGVVLLIYSTPIFIIFCVSSILYISWIVLFMRKRKEVDYLAFQEMANNQDSLIEIIQGMPEIKLQGSEHKRRWGWAMIQARLFRVQLRSLGITQSQDAGALSINQLKDILITFIAARAVVEGQMTLGMMLAVQYIVGQLNGPLIQMIQFIRTAQDASISLDRLEEVHNREEEEDKDVPKLNVIPDGSIEIQDLSFQYTPIAPKVLNNINLTIPRGKITAIVGTSGSGKTTLLKLLLGFYPPSSGSIRIGEIGLDTLHLKIWRAQCGVVMQDGYIFSDTIAKNISESDESVNNQRLYMAAKTANITDFIQSLPLSYNTMIGARGNGISQGQRQRMLIARAVYKNPEFILFDEATNSLDAKNERVIMDNLNAFFKGRTVIVVAHRLSTVKHADQIVVMDEGNIIEIGKHDELIISRGAYYSLVKNQLELSN